MVKMVDKFPDTDRSWQSLQRLCVYTKRQDIDVVKHVQQGFVYVFIWDDI